VVVHSSSTSFQALFDPHEVVGTNEMSGEENWVRWWKSEPCAKGQICFPIKAPQCLNPSELMLQLSAGYVRSTRGASTKWVTGCSHLVSEVGHGRGVVKRPCRLTEASGGLRQWELRLEMVDRTV